MNLNAPIEFHVKKELLQNFFCLNLIYRDGSLENPSLIGDFPPRPLGVGMEKEFPTRYGWDGS